MNPIFARPLALCAGALLAAFVALPARATLTFDLNVSFGDVNPGGDVVVTITGKDSDGVTKGVTITVTNNTDGFVKDLYLNYSGASLAGAAVTHFDHDSGDVASPLVTLGFQGFAIDFGFQTANNDPGRFGPGEWVSFDLDATGELSESLFDTKGGNPAGKNYFAAAQIIGVTATSRCATGGAKVGDVNGTDNSEGSNVFDCDPVISPGGGVTGTNGSAPEPQSLLLTAMGLLSLAFLRRRQRV